MSDKTKRRGYFKYMLAADSETTGLFFNPVGDNPAYDATTGKYHMAVSWGLIVVDADTFEPVEKLYVEIKWDGKSEWLVKAEQTHGLSKEYLAEHGMDEEDAMVEIANLIVKYWSNTPVVLFGHNIVTFDIFFLRDAMRRHGIELSFGNRHVDTNSIGFSTLGTYTSDELFEQVGLPVRGTHNAMEDIEYTLEAAKRIRTLFNSIFD